MEAGACPSQLGKGEEVMKREEHIVKLADGWLMVTVDLPKDEPELVMVLCHGLTGERIGPQQLLRRIGEVVARGGYACVRFDFRGSGDSSGAFEETTFIAMTEDLQAVCHWCTDRFTKPLVLAGVSMGGVVAALCAPDCDEAIALILVSSDLMEGVQMEAPPGGIRDGQFFLPDSFFSERSALSPRSALAASGLPAVLFYGGQDPEVSAEGPALAELGVSLEEEPSVGHLFETVRARHELGRRIVEWLAEVAPRR